MTSPWGKVDHVIKYAPGVSFVSTPSHGGIRISEQKIKQYVINSDEVIKLAGIKYGSYYYFEEDCAQYLLLFEAPSLLIIIAKASGKVADDFYRDCMASAKRWYPSFFEE